MKTVGLNLQGIWNYYLCTCHVRIFRKTRQEKHFSEQVVSVWKNTFVNSENFLALAYHN